VRLRAVKLLLLLFLSALGISCQSDDSVNTRKSSKTEIIMVEPTQQNPYLDLRASALNAKVGDLQLDLKKERRHVFGIIIDIAENEGSATIVSFRTGDASFYTSSGGGMIGGIGNENVRKAAIGLTDAAEASIPMLAVTSETPIPPAGRVRIYLLTDNAKYFGEEEAGAFFSENSKYPSISRAANNLVTQLRELDEGLNTNDDR
jgi:hypothetical protein